MSDELSFFNFDTLGATLEQLRQQQETAAAASRAAAATAAAQTRRVQASATAYADTARRAQERLDAIEADGARARELADSNNILDRFELIGAQILRPQRYTREVRTQRAAEISQGLALQGQIHNTLATEAQAIAASATARAASAGTGVEATLSSLRTRVTALQTMQAGMQATEALRIGSLERQTTADLAAARNATPDERGYVTLGDFQYTPLELAERHRVMQTREALALIPVNPENTPEWIAYNRIQMSTMSLDELGAIRENDYTLNGIAVPRAEVDQFYEERRANELTRLARSQGEYMARNQLPDAYSSAMDTLTRLREMHAPDSPMGQIAANYSVSVASVAELAQRVDDESADPSLNNIAQLEALSIVNANLQTQINAEAQRMANGDTALQPILAARLAGRDVGRPVVEEFVVERYAAGRGFSEAIDRGSATQIQRLADREFTRLMQARTDGQVLAAPPSRAETQEIRRAASRAAFQEWTNTTAATAAARTLDIAVEWLTAPESPTTSGGPPAGVLRSMGVSRADATQIIGGAADAAATEVQRVYGLTPEQFNFFTAGDYAAAGVNDSQAAEIAQSFNAAQMQFVYDQLDSVAPQAGRAYAQWFINNADSLASAASRELGPDAALIRPELLESIRGVARILAAVDNSADNRLRRMAVENLSGFNNPALATSVTINTTPGLTDVQRRTLYQQVVQPAIQAATQAGLGPDETMAAVVQALENVQGDAGLAAAGQRVMRHMPVATQTLEAAVQARMEELRASLPPLGPYERGLAGWRRVQLREQAVADVMRQPGTPLPGQPRPSMLSTTITRAEGTPPWAR